MSGKSPKRKPRPGVDEYGRTPLHYAALAGQCDQIRELVTSSFKVNCQDDNGLTPLHFSVQERHIEAVSLLLELGANPNILDVHGNGPLWTAILGARGDPLIVRALLGAGANPDQENKHGRSPRVMAETIGHGIEQLFRLTKGGA